MTDRELKKLEREYKKVLLRDPCTYCGMTERVYAVDHITARINGGTDDWTNLTAVCASCNSSKGTKSVIGFLGWKMWCIRGRLGRMQQEAAGWRKLGHR